MSTARKAPVASKARSQLTEEQKNEIKEAFDLFDTDGYVSLSDPGSARILPQRFTPLVIPRRFKFVLKPIFH